MSPELLYEAKSTILTGKVFAVGIRMDSWRISPRAPLLCHTSDAFVLWN